MLEVIQGTLDQQLLIATVVAVLAGLAHGFTGFGGALVAMPLYTVLFGPLESLAILVFAGVIGAAQLIPPAAKEARWPDILPMLAAAVVFTPLGVYSVVTVDPDLIRRAIGVIVLIGAVIIGSGWHYKGPRNNISGGVAGALAGYLTGSTGLGGPPLVAYMLAFPDPPSVQRANIVINTALLIILTLIGLVIAGAYQAETVVRMIVLTPLYMFGAWGGGRLFKGPLQNFFRRISLLLLVGGGITALVA